MLTLTLTKSAFEEICKHAQETYPEECCGIILSDESTNFSDSDTVYRCDNIQNKLHAEDPQKHPRDATIAYYMEPSQLLKILTEAEKKSLSIKAFYHSHPRHEAYFSAEDKARALAWNEPLYPDTAYLVISVYDRKVKDMRAFAWNESIKDFSPVDII
jgi:proteasome lid subunit RPN8/RPN11